MREQGDEPVDVERGPVPGEERADLLDDPPALFCLVSRKPGGKESPQPPLPVPFPALHPVTHPQAAIRPHLDVGGEDVSERLVGIDELEARPERSDPEGVDEARRRRAAEVGKEKAPVEPRREPGAGIGGKPGRPRADMPHRREDPGRLADERRSPQLLAVERAAIGEILHRPTPSRVSPRHDMHQARPVATVGVVVAGEAMPEIVEGELLGISQARRHDLETGAVGLAAEHGAALGVAGHAPLVLDVVAAVADREPQPPVWAESEAVEIVPLDRGADTVADMEGELLVSHAIAIGIAEAPQVGNAGVEDVAAASEDPGAVPINEPIEAGGKHRRGIPPAVAVGVDDAAQSVGLDDPILCLLTEDPDHRCETLVDGVVGEIGVEPAVVVDADVVSHPLVGPEGLADIRFSLLVD